MEYLKLTPEQKAMLDKPLPAAAISPHPTKKYLSSIKSIYVTERLNEVFGVGGWSVKSETIDNSTKMIVVKVHFTIPAYGIEYECYGGNDNADLGDAYKGATTDALTKIGSWLGIGAAVFKGEHKPAAQFAPAPRPTATAARQSPDPIAAAQPAPKRELSKIDIYDDRREEQKVGDILNLSNNVLSDSLLKWAHTRLGADDTAAQASELLGRCYSISSAVKARFESLYNSYLAALKNA